jgi:hypothetical protein
MFSVAVMATCTRIFSLVCVLNPAASTVTEYDPGVSKGTTKSPEALLLTVRVMPVA